MKKIIFAIVFACSLFAGENLMAQYKKIYLWDVTLSMKGYGGAENIYDEVLDWLVKDIDNTMDPNTTIIVAPFQAPCNNHGSILETKTIKATPEGKKDIISWIKSRDYKDVTYTDIAGAMKKARLEWVDDGDLVIILTDGKQNTDGGTATLVQEINNWCRLAKSQSIPPYTLFFMLTKSAFDEEVQRAIDNCPYIDNPPPGVPPLTFVLTPAKNLKANIKDDYDSSVDLYFTTDSSEKLPDGIKVRLTAPGTSGYLNIDGEYEIVNNKISIPLKFTEPYEQLRSYGDFLANESVSIDLDIRLLPNDIKNARVFLTSSPTTLTLINKPEKTVRIRIKEEK